MRCPPPDLAVQTPRLRLRLPDAADIAAFHALIAPDEVRTFLGSMGAEPKDVLNTLLRHAGSWALFGHGFFIVEDKATGALVGHCGVFRCGRGYGADFDALPECGWIIGRDHWGKGYAGEAMRGALGWFFGALGIQPVSCMIQEGNGPSEKVAAELGFCRFRTVSVDAEPAVNLYRREALPIEENRA